MINHVKQVKSQDKYKHVLLKYENRKLYLTEEGLYVSYDDVMEFIKKNESFVVYEDVTGKDITDDILRSVLAKVVKSRDMVPIDTVVDLLIKYVIDEKIQLVIK